MSDAPSITTFACTQCGGELHPDEGQIFLTCPYCNSTIYLDKSRVVFHWYLASTLDETKARFALARWMAGNQTVKDLDKKARLSQTSFEYFPVWYFKRRHPNGKEEILIEPAAATSVTEVRLVKVPAGDLRRYDPSLDSQAQPPSVPLTAVTRWLEERQMPVREMIEQALVHLPVFTFKYAYQGKTYTALVDAATGEVFANIFPAKAESPYQLVGGVAAVIFLCLASLPVLGAMAGEEFFAGGLVACLGLGILAVPILIGLAAWVAKKI